MTTFTVTDYSALHQSTCRTFADALEAAGRYFYGQGQLTVTIRDSHGCRWSYCGQDAVDLRECPAEAAGLGRCECHQR